MDPSTPAFESSPADLLADDDTLPPLKSLDEDVVNTTRDATKELAGRIFKAEGMTRHAFMKSDIAAKNRLMYRATTIMHCLPEYMDWLFDSIPIHGENPFIKHDTMAFRAIYNCVSENPDLLARIIQQKEKEEKNAEASVKDSVEESDEQSAEENVEEGAKETFEKVANESATKSTEENAEKDPEETEDEEQEEIWDEPTEDNPYTLLCKLLADNPEVAEVFILEVERRNGAGPEPSMVLNSLNEWHVIRERVMTVFKSRTDSSGHLYHYRT